MKAVHKSDNRQRLRRKRITDDNAKMVQIKDLIVDILYLLSHSPSLHRQFHRYDLRALGKQITGDEPDDDISMGVDNIGTYQWLFGFKKLARSYIDCSDYPNKDHRGRYPLTNYHISCACTTLNKIKITPEVINSISIGRSLIFDPDDVIKFLTDALTEITTYIAGSREKDGIVNIKPTSNIDIRANTESFQDMEEIQKIKNSEDVNRHFYNIPLRVRPFIGRIDLLKKLEASLFGSNRTADEIFVIHGIPGNGKTSLAVEFAYRYKNRFFGICWCQANSRENITSSICDLGYLLNIPPIESSDEERTAVDVLHSIGTEDKRWLLIYDNVMSPADINQFMPAEFTDLIITSRFSDWSDIGKSFSPDLFSINESAILLETLTEQKDRVGAELLADVLGCLPLALNHAGVLCRRLHMGFSEYAERVVRLIKIAPDASDYPKSVYATFEMTFYSLLKHDDALIILFVISQFGQSPIPIMLTKHIYEHRIDIELCLLRLSEISLIKIEKIELIGRVIIIHRLLQAVARDISIKLDLGEPLIFSAMDQIHFAFEETHDIQDSNRHLARLITSHAGAVYERLGGLIDRWILSVEPSVFVEKDKNQ